MFPSTGLRAFLQCNKSVISLVLLNVLGPVSFTAQPLRGIAPWRWRAKENTQISKLWIDNQILLAKRWYCIFFQHRLCWSEKTLKITWKLSLAAPHYNSWLHSIMICSSGSYLQHLHSFFMRVEALLLMVFGKSIWSMPRMVAVRIIIGSKPSNGSLETKNIYH